jgi:large conductance mechanosensitive channel
VVTALVTDIITPLIAAILGKPDFGDLTFTIHRSVFRYGALINAVISFLAIAATIYFVVVVPLNRAAERRARGGTVPPEEIPEDIALLTEIRDLLAGGPGQSTP